MPYELGYCPQMSLVHVNVSNVGYGLLDQRVNMVDEDFIDNINNLRYGRGLPQIGYKTTTTKKDNQMEIGDRLKALLKIPTPVVKEDDANTLKLKELINAVLDEKLKADATKY